MEATRFVHLHPRQLLGGEGEPQEELAGSGGAERGADGQILSTGWGWATLGIPDLAQLWRWWDTVRRPVRLCQLRAGSALCETGARCTDLPRLLETDFSLTHKRRRFLWNESPDQGWAAEKGFQLLAERKEIRPWDRRYCLLFDSATLINECFF